MYISIGGGNVVNTDDVIGIFDLDITSQSHITRKYLNAAEQNGLVSNAAEDLPKSYIVLAEKSCKNRILLCQPSAVTLQKRAELEKLN